MIKYNKTYVSYLFFFIYNICIHKINNQISQKFQIKQDSMNIKHINSYVIHRHESHAVLRGEKHN